MTARLAELPNVVGVKDSSGDASAMVRLCSKILPGRPDFSILTGWDAALLPMLAAGAHGGTNATANFAPEWVLEVYEQFIAGDVAGARAAQGRLTATFDAVFDLGEFPDGFRLAAEGRGALAASLPRLPVSDSIADETRATAERRLAGVLGALPPA